jgi:hypothetical protein
MNTTNTPGILMGLLALGCLLVVFIFLRKALRKTNWSTQKQNRLFRTTLFIVAAWIILIGVLAGRGFFAHFSTLPPRPVFLILFPFPVVLAIAFSKKFRTLALAIPGHWFIFFQSFRIFVELLLWRAFLGGALPVQMSFEGRNWDIISGVLALATGWIVMNRKQGYRTAALVYNIIGIGLLLNVLVVAVLSMPTPFRYFMNEPSVEKLAQFPMICLPSVLVVLAYSFHIFSLRQLYLKRKENHSALASHAAGVHSEENLIAG